MVKIEEEIQQKEFSSPQQKVIVNLLYTHGKIGSVQHRTLKPFGISIQQFNLLRILRGQHPEPASVKLLTERMLDKMSNASRLVDKLLAKDFVERQVSKYDRRQVDIVITKKGKKVTEEASTALDKAMSAFSLNDKDAEQLSKLLDKLRG